MSNDRDVSTLSVEEKRAMLAALLKKKAAVEEQVWPLSHGQRALWFVYRLDPSSSAYNIAIGVRIAAAVDVDALRRALAVVVSRHGILRASFPAADGVPRQVVKERHDLSFEQIDASGWSTPQLEARVAEIQAQPFDLDNGPAYRTALFSVSPREHVLLFALHHIIGDGASLAVLLSDIQRAYAAETGSTEAALSSLRYQYRDFAEWQTRMLAADGGRLEKYWTSALSGRLPVLELPTDLPRPAFQQFKGATVTFTLESAVVRELDRLARAEGVTLFAVLLAGFYALLSRYSGQTDIVVGTPALGRTRSEFESLVGYFVNPIALRATFDDDPSFRDFAKRVGAAVQGGLAHQDYPFPLLVERLQPDRDPARSPVFQAMFNLLRVPAPPGTDPEQQLPFAPFQLPQEEGQFDLALDLFDLHGELKAALRYDTALFAAPTAERMARHYQTLLASAAAAPQLQVSALSVLNEAEQRQILEQWNQTALEYDPAERVDAMVTAQAARTPEAVAVRGVDRTLSYAELETRSNQLAALLRSRGSGAGDLVGISLQRSTDLVVAVLAVLKSGAAYVPLDPAFPSSRLAHMVEDSRLKAIVTDEESERVLPSSEAGVIRIDADWPAIAAQSSAPSGLLRDPESPAYVLYTSGSTGRPKGVQIPHRALTNFMRAMQQRPGIGSSDVLVAVTTLSFDIAGLELLLPLTVGATVVIATADQARDGGALRRLLESSKATIMQATPATWHLLIDAGWVGSGAFVVLCGGEALPPALATQLLDRAGAVWNMYGPTETTIWSTVASVERDRPIDLGTPIANTQVYILDKHMRPAPAGVAGELCIGGDGVALGYLGRPDLTAERFIADPFAGLPGRRLYRTGDLARFKSGGAIEYLGRSDFQVKVRGFRIELGEIEAVLSSHAGVKHAVAGVVGADADARVVAWIVPERDGLDSADLRRHARQQLPEYMVPAAFVTLDALPLTPNGKVDRRALPPPVVDDRGDDERVAPRTATEQRIEKIWGQVLGSGAVSVHDNFFARGGHSLSAAQVMARVREAFSIDLPLRTIFEASTLAELAAAVDAALERTPPASVDASTSGGDARPALPALASRPFPDASGPLSYAQQRLWFFEQLEPGTSVFNIPFGVRLTGELDGARVRWALEQLTDRHETLRTSFAAQGSDAVQIVHDRVELPLFLRDLRGIPAEAREAAVERERAAASAPFDLEKAPLWRVILVRLSDREHVLFWTLHHLIADGWSLRVAMRELMSLYAGPPAASLPPLPVQYRDYARWQTVDVGDSGFDEPLDYWRAHLEGPLPALDLPTDAPRPAVQSFTGGACSTRLSAELSSGIDRLARERGATPFMVLFAAFQILLSRLSGQSDVIVGVPVAGRGEAALESLIGVFINTLPLRSQVRGEQRFDDFLDGVRHTAIEAFARQDVPFERIVRAVQPERDFARTPIFQTLFNMFDADHRAPIQTGGLSLTMEPAGQDWSSKFEVTLYATDLDGGMRLDLVYNAQLFGSSRAEEMLRQYGTLLEQVVAAPDTAIAHLSLVTAAAAPLLPDPRQPLAARWEGSVSARVRGWAASNRDGLAVVDPDEHLTFGELDARADAVASRMRAHGLKPGDRVAVVAVRSAALVPTLLGIWRAGAAFVLIDPSYPDQRVLACLDVSQPAGVIAMDDDASAALLARDWCAEHSAWWVLSRARAGDKAIAAVEGTDVDAEQLAYLAFTSGTTGRPKAVLGTHGPLSHFFAWHAREFGLTAGDRISVLSGLAHDPLLRDLFTPLWVGGTAVIPDGERLFEPEYLADWIRDERITVAHITPALASVVLAGSSDAPFPALRAVFCGGDRLRSPLAASLQRVAPAARIVNFYGATETPQAVGWNEVRPDSVQLREEIPVGRGIADVQLLVLTEQGRVAGVGELGEIHVRTPYLSRGYLGDEALTGARFVSSPFPAGVEDRMYRTGDWGRYLPDGRVQLVGRRDQQVKIRGFRIELGEVEAVLERHDEIRQAAASVYDDGVGEPRLVAYVVYEDGADPIASELRRFVRNELPDYMVPSLFVGIAALPLTPNGKVNRRALPSPAEGARRTVVREGPRTEMERLVASLWSQALGTDDISIHDNFFDIGGHSLLSMQVINRLEKDLGVRLPRRIIRDTLEQIGTTCEQLVAGKASAAREAVDAEPGTRS